MDIDNIVVSSMTNIRNPVFDFISVFIHYGLYFAVVIAGVLVLYFVKKKKEFFLLITSLAFSAAFVYIIKSIVMRLRPEVIFELFLMDPYSFPSGHTATAFAIATSMSYYSKKRNQIILFSLAIIVGLSRMYLGAHYLTDVITGALIGILTSTFVKKYEKVVLKWEKRISKKMRRLSLK